MSDEIVQNRYDFILLFDVKDGNPNGDPDGGNLPRIDPETGQGLVTDVCIKRKVRNYIDYLNPGTKDNKGYEIYVKEGPTLKEKIISTTDPIVDKREDKKKLKPEETSNLRKQEMIRTYYDIRTFGAVMSFKDSANAGQVRGPIQLTFGRSIDPIFPHEHTLTTVVAADKAQSMGRKSTVPYGLYRMYGFVTPHFAEQTGFTEEDLELFWQALRGMFDLDHSAARGLMSLRKLILFKHDSKLGNVSAQALFERVQVECKDKSVPARDFTDYSVKIDRSPIEHVELIELV